MFRPRVVVSIVAALAVLAWLPAPLHAQSAITGVAKDSSGAVLPGVTVEASSDVLIERVRTVTTNGQGQYTIVDLRPGVYVVTFTLPGFQTFRRENVDLPTQFTATINAEMRVGAVEESVTVNAFSPVVDVTTAVHTQVLNREAIDNIPTGRTIQGVGQLIVGVNLNLPDTGGARGMQQTYMSTHGMSAANNTVLVDGMMVNGLQLDGAVQSYFNDAMNQEVSYQTSGIGAETSSGGVRLNMIPREGGNRFSGSFSTAYRPNRWQGDNVTPRLSALNLATGNATERIVDATFAQGGPVKKDKLWFFTSARYFSVNNFIANTTFDDGSKGVDDQYIRSALARVTWQVSPRHKFSAYFDEIDKYRGHDMQSLVDPETAAIQWFSPAYHTAQVKWTSTVSSRLMIDAGWSSNLEYYTNSYRPGIEKVRFSADWFANASRLENDLGGRKTAATSQTTESPARYNMQAAATYVTGSHNVKTGFQLTWGQFIHTVDANADLTQQYRSNATRVAYSVPDTVVVRNTPLRSGERLNADLGLYAQDSWTLKRLSVNAGIRWEYLNAQVLAGESPAGRFVPARAFPEKVNLPRWKDWAPRFGVVYDLFGNAKTALKYSVNRYNQQRTTGIADQYNGLRSSTQTLTWRDFNGDDIAQGFVTFLPDGSRQNCVYQTPGCEIDFANLPANFGTQAFNEYGAYPRTWNLEHAVEVQQELLPRLSVTGSWFHGSFHNLTTTIDQNLTYADYTPIDMFNPLDGTPLTIYSRTTASLGRAVRNLDTFDPKRERLYEAFSLEFRARIGGGGSLFGGTSFERQRDVNCTSPDNPNSLIYCNDRANAIPFRKNVKIAGSYRLPWGFVASGAFQSNKSPSATSTGTTRNFTISRTTRYPATCPSPCPAGAVIAPALNQATLTIPVVPFNAAFVERITQLDLKLARTFKLGRVSVAPTVEMFNVNNSDAIISYLSTNITNASYERPNSIMQPRMVGVGAQVKW